MTDIANNLIPNVNINIIFEYATFKKMKMTDVANNWT